MTRRLAYLAIALFPGAAAFGQVIRAVDYADSFTLGRQGRQNGIFNTGSPAYDVEDPQGNPATTWRPFTNFSFNDVPGSINPDLLSAAGGNPGAADGFAQSGGGDFSFAYGLRASYAVELEAILPLDRLDVSSLPAAGADIFAPGSLSIFFRRDSVAGTPHPAFPATGIPGIGVFNGALETAVTDDAGSMVLTGVDDDDWHGYGVIFDQPGGRVEIFVDGASLASLDLATFGGGAYQTFSGAAVGAGGAGYRFSPPASVLWLDNFQVGLPVGGAPLSACFHHTPTSPVAPAPVNLDAGCSSSAAGTINSYAWDFGDGQTAQGAVVDHAFAFPDNYTVTLTVKDSAGNTATTQQLIAVQGSLLPYVEEFDRPAGPVDGWTVFSGDWLINDAGKLETLAAGQENWVWAGDPPGVMQGDLVARFDMEFAAKPADGVGRHAGAFFFSSSPTRRWQASGYDVWWIDRGQDFGISLRRWDNGNFTFLTPGTFAQIPEPPLHWRIEVNGPSIRVYGDDVLYVDVVDSTYREGHFGLWAYLNGQDVLFDDISIRNEAARPVIACFQASPEPAPAGGTVHFDAGCSKALGGAVIASYTWEFGDGKTGAGASADHLYDAAGSYVVKLKVSDAAGNSDTVEKTVAVREALSPFVDCFDRPEGPPDGWIPYQGTWGITAGKQLENVTDGIQEGWLWAGAPPRITGSKFTAEFTLEYLARPGDAVGRHGGAAFCASAPTIRWDGSFRGYFVDWIDRTVDRGLRFTRVDGGALVEIVRGAPGSPDEPPLHWRIEVDEQNIRLFGDDVLYIDVPDATYRGGYFGLWTYLNGQDAVFDDLRVTSEDPLPAFQCPGVVPPAGRFVRGDVDESGSIDLTDAVRLLGFLFLGGATPGCLDAADADDSSAIDLTDAINILNFLFLGGAAPAKPNPGTASYTAGDCGVDPTDDGLTCLSFQTCH